MSVHLRRLLLVISLAFFLPHTIMAAPTYHVTDLGAIPADGSSYANGISGNGQIVGGISDGSIGHAFYWTSGGGMQDIGTLPGGEDESFSWSVNNSGTVVGYSGAAGGDFAFLWTSSGGMQNLGQLPGGDGFSVATFINNGGQVVGVSDVPGGEHGFLWTSSGGMQDLGDLPGGDNNSIAYGINSSGQIAGWGAGPAGFRAVIWSSGGASIQDLGTLPGGSQSWANAINDSGQIAGAAYTASGAQHAIRWTSSGGMQDLGDIPGGVNYNEAYGINGLGQAVGYAYIDAGLTDTHGFLWTDNGGMVDLNSIVNSSGAGWELQAGVAANDAGQITGYGVNPDGATHAFLLDLVGDLNGDGAVNNFDISAFETALADPSAFLAIYPDRGDYSIRGDVNDDGSFNNFDIASFEQLLTAGQSVPVPEPSSAALMGLGIFGLTIARRRRAIR